MATDTYPASYVTFMAEAKAAYIELRERIANGEVPGNSRAKIALTVPVDLVDRVRLEVLEAALEEGEDGN